MSSSLLRILAMSVFFIELCHVLKDILFVFLGINELVVLGFYFLILNLLNASIFFIRRFIFGR